jgi:hypothetical protein
MKISITILAAVLLVAGVWAQSPEIMNYQAVIRDNSNALITNQTIGMRVSILRGSQNGTEVYKEIYNPNPLTNINGLVTIQIGSGIPLTGVFANIDWTNGPYFIKTETDPTGGTNYTITGTSQLLSSPYSLHSKTAQSVTGPITESDPFYLSSQAAYINANDIFNLDNLSGVNSGDEDGSETKINAGTDVTVSGTGTIGNPYVINATGGPAHAIGDSYQGGKIFWIDASGQHGLIAATTDQSVSLQWSNGIYRATGATGDGLYAGEMNTAMIIATQMADNQAGSFAAKTCANYSASSGGITYGDWYLPSKYEIGLLYAQKTIIGGFANALYWTSTERSENKDEAHDYDFGTGNPDYHTKNQSFHVRAIRAF